MAVRTSFHPDFQESLKRLALYDVDYADSVIALVRDYLSAGVPVPDAFKPHMLVHRREKYSGFWECHADVDVLVIYRANASHVVLRDICTHGELEMNSIDHSRWPDPDEEREKLAEFRSSHCGAH